jgi:hypothetical protein
MVPMSTPGMSQHHDNMLNSHPGRGFCPSENAPVACIPRHVNVETSQRKRKREATPDQEEDTKPDDVQSKKKQKLIGLRIAQPHLSGVAFNDLPAASPVPSTGTVLGRAGTVGCKYSKNKVDQSNLSQGVPSASDPSKGKRKRTDEVAETKPTKKRKKVDNGQQGGTNGSPLAVNRDVYNGPDQDVVRAGSPSAPFDQPLPTGSDASATPPPMVPPAPWAPPVPTIRDLADGVQGIEPAPASRFTSGSRTGKKTRYSAWHVWSEVYTCTFRNREQLILTGSLLDPSRTVRINGVFPKLAEWCLRREP